MRLKKKNLTHLMSKKKKKKKTSPPSAAKKNFTRPQLPRPPENQMVRPLIKGGGKTCLPQSKFYVKFHMGLHVILKLHKKQKTKQNKKKPWLNQMHKIILNESLAPLFKFKWALFSNHTVIRFQLAIFFRTWVAKNRLIFQKKYCCCFIPFFKTEWSDFFF